MSDSPKSPRVFLSHASEDKDRFVLGFGEKLERLKKEQEAEDWMTALLPLVDELYDDLKIRELIPSFPTKDETLAYIRNDLIRSAGHTAWNIMYKSNKSSNIFARSTGGRTEATARYAGYLNVGTSEQDDNPRDHGFTLVNLAIAILMAETAAHTIDESSLGTAENEARVTVISTLAPDVITTWHAYHVMENMSELDPHYEAHRAEAIRALQALDPNIQP